MLPKSKADWKAKFFNKVLVVRSSSRGTGKTLEIEKIAIEKGQFLVKIHLHGTREQIVDAHKMGVMELKEMNRTSLIVKGK
jgi:hypothetical protein